MGMGYEGGFGGKSYVPIISRNGMFPLNYCIAKN